MPGIRTEITEIVTGLAMLGYQDLPRALEVRPRHITHVDEPVFERLDQAWASGAYASDFAIAWENGYAFAPPISACAVARRGRWSGRAMTGQQARRSRQSRRTCASITCISCRASTGRGSCTTPARLRSSSTCWRRAVASADSTGSSTSPGTRSVPCGSRCTNEPASRAPPLQVLPRRPSGSARVSVLCGRHFGELSLVLESSSHDAAAPHGNVLADAPHAVCALLRPGRQPRCPA